MLVFIIAIYKRHELTRIVLDYYRELQNKYPFKVVIAGSEGKISKDLAHGFEYIEAPNSPLTFKNNAMMQKAMDLSPDAIVLLGSDDLICENVIKYYYDLINDKEDGVCGFNGLYFHDVNTGKSSYYNASANFGAGRYFPKSVLEKINYKGWERAKDKGCDNENKRVLMLNGVKIKSISLEEINGYLVDIKHDFSITSKNITLVGKQLNYNIMPRVSKKVTDEVNALKEEPKKTTSKAKPVEIESNIPDDFDKEKEYTIVSTGKSKHMKAGLEYVQVGESALNLVLKGYAVFK